MSVMTNTADSDNMAISQTVERYGTKEKSRRIEAFCELGALSFSATRQDLHSIRLALTLDSGDKLDRLDPCAGRLLDAARTLDDVLEFSPYCEMSIGVLLAEAEREIGPNASRLL